MAVPNTNTFTMKDVCNEIGVSYPGTSLNELFALANDSGFDSLYKGNKDGLYNFRNYQHILPTVLEYNGIYETTGVSVKDPVYNYKMISLDTPYGVIIYFFSGSISTHGNLYFRILNNPDNITTYPNTISVNKSEFNFLTAGTISTNGRYLYIVSGKKIISPRLYVNDVDYRPDVSTAPISQGEIIMNEDIHNMNLGDGGDDLIVSTKDGTSGSLRVYQGRLNTSYVIDNISMKRTITLHPLYTAFFMRKTFAWAAAVNPERKLVINWYQFERTWNTDSPYFSNTKIVEGLTLPEFSIVESICVLPSLKSLVVYVKYSGGDSDHLYTYRLYQIDISGTWELGY